MPQIRCPNCGLTINLESRKEIDVDLITNATCGKAKTFTSLLRETKLPRKTLSLRLKELCADGRLLKEDGVYVLNGMHDGKNKWGVGIPKFSNIHFSKKVNSALLLITVLMMSSPIAAYVLAGFFVSQSVQKPVMLGEFIMAVEVYDVVDLYAWQIAIAFNQSELEVLEVTSGGFVGDKFPKFVYAIREDGLLILAGFLAFGEARGKDGSGVLARIVFGYLVEEYQEPEIMSNEIFETVLFDSEGARDLIPMVDSAASLKLVMEHP